MTVAQAQAPAPCRRRAILRQRAASGPSAVVVDGPSALDDAEQRRIIKGLPDTPKGHCPKCGKHVGRGITFHVRRCQG